MAMPYESGGQIVEDIVTVAVVNFEPEWGNTRRNRERMIGYMRVASKRGADLVVFPETALSGYDADLEHGGDDQMQRRVAEPLDGPTAHAFAAAAKEYGVYAVYGAPERDGDAVYNAAVVVSPQGEVVGSYRKLHLPFLEARWADRGLHPFMFDTPWGPVGVAICYDTYVFSEIMRFYRAQGCRLFINCTAVDEAVTANNVRTAVEYLSATNCIYIASANCIGCYRDNHMIGGSNIVGPSSHVPAVHYYAGHPFGSSNSDEQELFLGTLDLSRVQKSFLAKQWDDEEPDFTPKRYINMYQQLMYQKRFK